MNSLYQTATRLLAPAALLVTSLTAQLAPAPAPSAGKRGDEVKEDVVRLNAFEVQADPDATYGALNSNSITRFNTELYKLPVTADVFNRAFMDDVAATTVEELIQSYSAGVGFSATDPGAVAANSQPGDRNANSYATLRGFYTPTIMRDGLMPTGAMGNQGATGVGITSNFDVERVEVIAGPQALIYGISGPGGVINMTSKVARFTSKPAGSLRLQWNEYGSAMGLLDYNISHRWVAARLSLIESATKYQRENIGGRLKGFYLQLAVRLPGNTTLRFTGNYTDFNRIVPSTTSNFSGPSAPNVDPRGGHFLSYLVATNQTGATNPVTGARYPAGALDNGYLNWDNYASYSGWWNGERMLGRFSILTAQTEWTRWLSTEVAAGYSDTFNDRTAAIASLAAPGVAANTTGTWAVLFTQPNHTTMPTRNRALRFSALLANNPWGGKAKSQTILGADYIDSHAANHTYSYFRADENFNIIVNPALVGNTNGGRTRIAATYTPVPDGPIFYPLGLPGSRQMTYNGINYALAFQNPPDSSRISPTNPLGTIPANGNYQFNLLHTRGIFANNNTEWLKGRLVTMAGVRMAAIISRRVTELVNYKSARQPVNVNVGANFGVNALLRVYANYCSSSFPPIGVSQDPVGKIQTPGRGIGTEFGLKLQNADGTISGSLAYYHAKSRNETYVANSTYLTYINPAGLNGSFENGTASLSVDRVSEGVQLNVTAAPAKNWRLRFSGAHTDGRLGTSQVFPQLYNDQFHQNRAGQVTYADGTIVYVNPTFNVNSPTVPSTQPGAIPLTVAMIGTRGNPYFGNPQPVNAQIQTSSAVASVLRTVDPVHGAILTGVTGLPISQLQVDPGANLPPGVIPVLQEGQKSTGTPEFSGSFTSLYTIANGRLKGLELGGTARGRWLLHQFYYYPTGFALGRESILYTRPNQGYFDLIVGYKHKFNRVGWRTQLNVSNLFNNYHLIVVPNQITGWSNTTQLRATLDAQPRTFVWSNTITF